MKNLKVQKHRGYIFIPLEVGTSIEVLAQAHKEMQIVYRDEDLISDPRNDRSRGHWESVWKPDYENNNTDRMVMNHKKLPDGALGILVKI